MKKIITLLTAMALACSCFIFSVSAVSTASISLSSKSPKVNDTVTVTVTVKSGAAMYGTEFNVSYNQSVLKFVSGDSANGGAGVIKVASGVTGATSQSYSLKFTAIAAGSSTIAVSGGAFLETADETISASASLNVSDASKSTNANLSSLRTSAGSLSPKFSANTTSYTVNVNKNITECKVYCSTADPNATVSVVGSATLKIGENKRVVTVTAPSGAQKSYTITIIRSDEEVVSDTSSSATEPSALETVIGGVSYVVIKDISSIELPVGFNVTKRLYNNEEISVAVDTKENFELFYLKASGSNEAYPYTYDSENNVFNKVQIITQGSNSYIVSEIPEDLIVPEGYISKTVKIQEMSVKAYASTDVGFEDMYYIYCYFNGEYNMYRYDNVEKILQRSPEVKLVSAKGEPTDSSNIEFVNRFNKLSTNAKTIVVCLLIAFVGVIALTVLLIIKLIKRSKQEDFDLVGYEEDFDSVRFDDDFEIIPETPDDETEE